MANTRTPRADVPKPDPADISLGKTLDLSARAAARAKSTKKGPKVKVGTVTYQLPPELPFPTVVGVLKLMGGDPTGLETLLDDLFGHDSYNKPTEAELELLKPAQRTAREKAYNPGFESLSLEDIGELFQHVNREYGLDLGNSKASTPS